MSDAQDLFDTIAERLLGARIVEVVLLGSDAIRVEFEHKGTDEDSGWFVVEMEEVTFG